MPHAGHHVARHRRRRLADDPYPVEGCVYKEDLLALREGNADRLSDPRAQIRYTLGPALEWRVTGVRREELRQHAVVGGVPDLDAPLLDGIHVDPRMVLEIIGPEQRGGEQAGIEDHVLEQGVGARPRLERRRREAPGERCHRTARPVGIEGPIVDDDASESAVDDSPAREVTGLEPAVLGTDYMGKRQAGDRVEDRALVRAVGDLAPVVWNAHGNGP